MDLWLAWWGGHDQPKEGATIRRHRENVHMGVRYPCHQCEYQASVQENLRKHILSKHEGVRKYHCK